MKGYENDTQVMKQLRDEQDTTYQQGAESSVERARVLRGGWGGEGLSCHSTMLEVAILFM